MKKKNINTSMNLILAYKFRNNVFVISCFYCKDEKVSWLCC